VCVCVCVCVCSLLSDKKHCKFIDRLSGLSDERYAHLILVHVSNLLSICVCIFASDYSAAVFLRNKFHITASLVEI